MSTANLKKVIVEWQILSFSINIYSIKLKYISVVG
jgi:hypothetical protein